MEETQRRKDLIRELLATHRDALESFRAGDGRTAAEGSWGHWMPNLYHSGDYAKLERYLYQLRDLCPELYRHLAARYLRSVIVRRLMKLEGSKFRTRPNEKPLSSSPIVEGLHRRFWVRVECWEPWVSEQKVDWALAALEKAWPGPVRVPRWDAERESA